MSRSLTVTLANLICFEKRQLPPPLANRLIRLTPFQSPEFYKAQAMRMSVWDNARARIASGQYTTAEDVEARFAARRAELRAEAGGADA
jgi:hypothetical protein